VENVHFLLDWGPPDLIGSKSLAVNLSDIAACGGEPRDAFISVAVPHYIDVDWLDGFYKGMSDLAREFGVNLLGGDTTGSKGHLVINVALTGLVPSDQVLFRHTARHGDRVILTGATGESAAGVDILLWQAKLPEIIAAPLIKAQLNPKPHVRAGRFLAQSLDCTAAIDVSDGLSSDLGHICKDSGVGAVIYEERLPKPPSLLQAAEYLGKNPMNWILNGGEDYVLLGTIKPDKCEELVILAQQSGISLIPIGEITDSKNVVLIGADGSKTALAASGWNHFK
jgi:thiamine-monophosphate kinase